MENKEIIKKYSITKKTALLIMMQIILLMIAFILSVYGIYKSLNSYNNLNRIIIYTSQALTCLVAIIFGIYFFNKKETKYFRSVIIAYAILEALRVSLLQTGGVGELPSFLAKIILVSLAYDAALLSDRVEKKEGLYLSLTMVSLEIILYLVFILGFPQVRTKALYIILPFVSILMAGSMCIFVTGRLEQKKYDEENKKKK